MEYVKKVLMLKRIEQDLSQKPLSVLARIEVESGVAEFYISVINLPNNIKSDNYYALVVDGEKKEFEFDLGNRPTSLNKNFFQMPSVEKGIAIGLYCTAGQIPITLAFASQGQGITLSDFKKIVADKCYAKFKQNITKQSSQNIEKVDCQKQVEGSETSLRCIYDDEAVATENYYEIDEEIKQKITSIKENGSEDLFFENEYANNPNQKAQKEERTFFDGDEDEKDACFGKQNKDLANELIGDDCENYYLTVKDELEQIFFSYEREENLEKVFKGSKWAKIYYVKDKFYVVGLVYEKDKEKYICYGVPSKYKKAPPKELEGYSSFIPLSVFDMFGDGYFIMFQDAKTGTCVHFN